MTEFVRDPRLLPYYLTPEQVGAVCQMSPKTILRYCRRGILRRGTHWVRPAGQRRFLRDAVLAWPEERETPRRTMPRTALNLAVSGDLAAALEREGRRGL